MYVCMCVYIYIYIKKQLLQLLINTFQHVIISSLKTQFAFSIMFESLSLRHLGNYCKILTFLVKFFTITKAT